MSFAPVTPVDLERAERIVQALSAAYPTQEPQRCYATAAHLLGHRSWHALVEAVSARAQSAPFDEAFKEDAFWSRRAEQERILCAEMSGVDRHGSHLSNEDFNALPPAGGALSAARDRRRGQNAARWAILYAQELMFEIEPTAEAPLPLPWYPNWMGVCELEQLEAMPAALAAWWAANVYAPSPVSQALRNWKLEPHRLVSLLSFGRYWGTVVSPRPTRLDVAVQPFEGCQR